MQTKKINLTITGCLGRMGQQLIKSANKDKRFKIISLTENKILSLRIWKIFLQILQIKPTLVFLQGGIS